MCRVVVVRGAHLGCGAPAARSPIRSVDVARWVPGTLGRLVAAFAVLTPLVACDDPPLLPSHAVCDAQPSPC
jgi:hypothetical protein